MIDSTGTPRGGAWHPHLWRGLGREPAAACLESARGVRRIACINNDDAATNGRSLSTKDGRNAAQAPTGGRNDLPQILRLPSISFSRNAASYFPRPRLRSQTTTSIRRLYARNGYVLDKRRRNGGIRAVSARARTFSKLFPVLRIGIAFDAFKYYVRREPGLVCMVPDDRLKILFRMLSLFKAFIDPNIGVGFHHSF